MSQKHDIETTAKIKAIDEISPAFGFGNHLKEEEAYLLAFDILTQQGRFKEIVNGKNYFEVFYKEIGEHLDLETDEYDYFTLSQLKESLLYKVEEYIAIATKYSTSAYQNHGDLILVLPKHKFVQGHIEHILEQANLDFCSLNFTSKEHSHHEVYKHISPQDLTICQLNNIDLEKLEPWLSEVTKLLDRYCNHTVIGKNFTRQSMLSHWQIDNYKKFELTDSPNEFTIHLSTKQITQLHKNLAQDKLKKLTQPIVLKAHTIHATCSVCKTEVGFFNYQKNSNDSFLVCGNCEKDLYELETNIYVSPSE